MGRRSADSRCHLRNVPLFLPRGFPLARFRDTTAAAYLGGAGLFTLVLKRRDIVGGCCVTEEIAPGCRASTTYYIASMLRPEVIRDLELASHGLRMVPCDPMLQVPFLNAQSRGGLIAIARSPSCAKFRSKMPELSFALTTN